jgi:hypothetical protein
MPIDSDVHAVIEQLNNLGIDTSLSPSDLAEFMGNPDFTPYPATAEALIGLLNNGLRKPVFIDVIVFNYENTPGVVSPRKLEDVDTGVLRKAVVDAWSERYGEIPTGFASLLK